MEYNKNNKEDILFDIRRLDNYLQYIPSNERKKYVDYLCKKDRYFLKAKNSIVNMTFLVNKSKADIREGDLLKCVREQKPEKIKLHKNDSFWKFLNSSEYEEEVLKGFESEAAVGK